MDETTTPNRLGLPTTEEATALIREWRPDPSVYRGREILPERGRSALKLKYDRELRRGGMTFAHALDADPRLISRVGREKYEVEPAYFMEGFYLAHSDLLTIRQDNVLNERAGRDLVTEQFAALDQRLAVRQEWLIWSALKGAVSIVDENGVSYTETWDVQTYDASAGGGTLWTTTATADPIKDFGAVRKLARGKGFTFQGARAYMNQTTADLLLSNAKLIGLLEKDNRAGLVVTAESALQYFSSIAGVVPTVYDEGYIDDSNTWIPFIPDNRVVVVGRTTMGEELGYLGSVPSASNGGIDNPQPGKFAVVEDEVNGNKNPHYAGYVGWFGAPVLFHPEYICYMTVGA